VNNVTHNQFMARSLALVGFGFGFVSN